MSGPDDRTEVTSRLNAALEGRYYIRDEIGRGGMATVYLADDLRHDRQVALKVLDPELAAVLGADRFLAEIRTTAGLQHPHILPLFDSGEADGFLFYVMPYVEGESLRDRLDRDHQLPVENAIRLAEKLADALDYAHRHGVIHRDIKPGNVLLHDGEPVIADFGIALAAESVGGNRLTETGLSLGTPQYMSPEQATGDHHVGPAADIYALGCVLYETLVGEPPFTGSTPQAILGRIITGEVPSATKERASVPEHVDGVIRKALEKLPADRFQSAGEMGAALSDPGLRHRLPTSDAPEPPARLSGGRTAALFALGAALGAVTVGWALSRPEPVRPVERWVISDPLFQNPSAVPAISPDGASLLLRSGDGRLWLKEAGSVEPTLVAGAENLAPFSAADFSPNGDEFVFVANGELRVSELGGGSVRTLADSAFCCPRWEADDFVYFSGRGNGIERVHSTGGMREVVTEVDGGWGHADFALLPRGDAGVFYILGAPSHPPRIDAVELQTGRQSAVVAGRRPYVTPEGDLLYWSDGDLRVDRIDLETLSLEGAPATVETGIGTVEPRGYPMFSVSSSGTLLRGPDVLGALTESVELRWVSRSGVETPVDSGWTFPSGPGAFNMGWSLSPDEDRIATWSAEGGDVDVWIKDLSSGSFSPLTFEPGMDAPTKWAPDGREVLLISDRGSGNVDLWSRSADGAEEARLVHDAEDPIAYGFWSPDREWLVLRTAGRASNRDIVAVRAGGGDEVLDVAATAAREEGPALSPDGRWLAYSSDASGRIEIYIVGFPDRSGPWRISQEGGIRPVWAYAGDELFYVNSQRQMVSVRLEFQGAPRVTDRETLFTIPPEYHVQPNGDFYSVSRDGQRFLMGARGSSVSEPQEGTMVLVKNWWEAVAGAPSNRP